MKIIGVDPGLDAIGYCLMDARNSFKPILVEAGVISTKRSMGLGARLKEIFKEVSGVIDRFKPHIMAIESLFSVYKHPRTAILMGHARGVILLAASTAGIEIVDYTPLKIKKSLTGSGRASKEQMERMVQSRMGLKTPPRPSHIADAIAAALCHCNVLSHMGGNRV